MGSSRFVHFAGRAAAASGVCLGKPIGTTSYWLKAPASRRPTWSDIGPAADPTPSPLGQRRRSGGCCFSALTVIALPALLPLLLFPCRSLPLAALALLALV